MEFLRGNYRIIFATIAAGLGTSVTGVNYAYNGVQSIIEPFIAVSFLSHYGYALSTPGLGAIWGAMASMSPIGAVFGSLSMEFFAEKFGRKTTGLAINSLVAFSGALVSGMSKPLNCFELIFLGRFLLGFSQGLGRLIPVYMAECALDSHRGFIGALSTLCCFMWDPIALVLAQTWALGTSDLWPLLVAYAVVPNFICATLVYQFMHESPKYLHITKNNEKDAIRALKFYHGEDVPTKEILVEYSREHQQALERNNQPTASIMQIFAIPHLRRAFLVAVMVIISVTIVGESLASQYSTKIFESAGFVHEKAVLSSLLSVLPGLFSMILAMIFIEKFGRRPLVLSAMIMGVIANTILTLTADSRPYLAVCGIILIKVAHDGGSGPVGNFISGDICPQAIRAKSTAVGWTLHHVIEVLVVFLFPTLQELIGNFTFSIFAVTSFVFLLWLWAYLPETKQRSVDSIVDEWVVLLDKK